MPDPAANSVPVENRFVVVGKVPQARNIVPLHPRAHPDGLPQIRTDEQVRIVVMTGHEGEGVLHQI